MNFLSFQIVTRNRSSHRENILMLTLRGGFKIKILVGINIKTLGESF